jgi:hypothetical protein
MSELDTWTPDHTPYPCRGCGREATDHNRAWMSTPLGMSVIRVCDDVDCAKAAAESVRAQFTKPGDVVKVLRVERPPA